MRRLDCGGDLNRMREEDNEGESGKLGEKVD